MIKIDRYDSVLEDGKIKYYAIAGKKKYEMPDCYHEMYDDTHLAIEERTLTMPELYSNENEETKMKHYIPLNTSFPEKVKE